MDDFEPLSSHLPPTNARPLLGVTVLVVDDSRYTSEALRMLCLLSGARLRRADCIASAKRHLQVYRPSVLIIDLGLPDGSGLSLIEEVTALCPRIEIVLGLSGDDHLESAALAAGADGFFTKPIESVAQFQETILARMPEERRPLGPRPIIDEAVRPDALSYNDDLMHISALIEADTDNIPTMRYAAQFVSALARSAHDQGLERAAGALQTALSRKEQLKGPVSTLAREVKQRLERQLAI